MNASRQRQEARYQRFVGAELAPVLEEVHRAHGSRARIVSVDRVRQGGVAGFFAREVYEVLVDSSPEPTAAGATDAAGAIGAAGAVGAVAHEPPRRTDLGNAPPPALSFADLLERRLRDEDLLDLDHIRSAARPAPVVEPMAEPPAVAQPQAVPVASDVATPVSNEPDPELEPVPEPVLEPVPEPGLEPDPELEPEPARRMATVGDWTVPGPGPRLVPVHPEPRRPVSDPVAALEFWADHDQARIDAELLAVPAVALSAVVGHLTAVEPVVERLAARHWSGSCEVIALTARPLSTVPDHWRTVRRTEDVVAIVEDSAAEFPLLVIDTPRQLADWVRPLLDRLRLGGLGLVHYVLEGHPSDEDLATWHGEIGRPAVLDLVAQVGPGRVLDLIERGEPIASVAGVPVTADLLLALRAEMGRAT